MSNEEVQQLFDNIKMHAILLAGEISKLANDM